MTVLGEVLEANEEYAGSFGARSELALPPARGFAILTCMDARLDPAKYAGLSEGDAHVIRNAGGRASDDAIRSLVISYKLLGTARVVRDPSLRLRHGVLHQRRHGRVAGAESRDRAARPRRVRGRRRRTGVERRERHRLAHDLAMPSRASSTTSAASASTHSCHRASRSTGTSTTSAPDGWKRSPAPPKRVARAENELVAAAGPEAGTHRAVERELRLVELPVVHQGGRPACRGRAAHARAVRAAEHVHIRADLILHSGIIAQR